MDSAFEKGEAYIPGTESEAKEWLLKVFKRFPKMVGENVMDTWRFLGPFDIESKITQKTVKLQYNLELVDKGGFSYKKDYFGQLNKAG